jgi:hypothetical protein
MKKILFLFALVCLMFMAGCAKHNPAGPGPSSGLTFDIDIKGKWLFWFAGTPYLATITSTHWGYTNAGIDSTVLKFDNTLDYCIVYWNNHPSSAYLNKYQKIGWTNVNPVYFVCKQYTPTNSSVLAENNTNVIAVMTCSNRP